MKKTIEDGSSIGTALSLNTHSSNNLVKDRRNQGSACNLYEEDEDESTLAQRNAYEESVREAMGTAPASNRLTPSVSTSQCNQPMIQTKMIHSFSSNEALSTAKSPKNSSSFQTGYSKAVYSTPIDSSFSNGTAAISLSRNKPLKFTGNNRMSACKKICDF